MLLLESIVTTSGLALPDASPLQPANCQPVAGLAVSCTRVPWLYSGWSGVFVTAPVPTVDTASVYWLIANVAVMSLLESIVTVSGFALPDASPLQPTKCQPVAGIAVRSTMVPWSYSD